MTLSINRTPISNVTTWPWRLLFPVSPHWFCPKHILSEGFQGPPCMLSGHRLEVKSQEDIKKSVA